MKKRVVHGKKISGRALLNDEYFEIIDAENVV